MQEKIDSKLVVRMFCITVHRLLARVQRPTCTIYGKCLLKSIMTVLTPKSGIVYLINHVNFQLYRIQSGGII